MTIINFIAPKKSNGYEKIILFNMYFLSNIQKEEGTMDKEMRKLKRIAK